MKVLYIGGFHLPDKNAAANRIIGIAKILRSLGHEVDLLSEIKGLKNDFILKEYFNFRCYEYTLKINFMHKIRKFYDISHFKEIISKNGDYDLIIGYELPSLSSLRIRTYCKKRSIKYVLDLTEWDSATELSVSSIGSNLNIFLNMRLINKYADGLIVISSYLKKYYEKRVPTILIPPLVDIKDQKWNLINQTNPHESIELVFAGNISRNKEDLLSVVTCLEKQKENKINLNIIGVTKKQFCKVYKVDDSEFNSIKFFGKCNHNKTLSLVKAADYSLIIRPINRKTRAGFPTKFVESVTLGTPVIATDTSDLKEYIDKYRCGIIVEKFSLDFISQLNKKQMNQLDIFDYRKYQNSVKVFLELINKRS